ncbi:Sec23/Sec24 trunk domain-containing protein [Mycena rebaudengoi]|nr:Sec23/Sec24 trunk domain-containing protein [Mycena rebaudengoi]
MSNEVPQMFDWVQVRNQPGDRWARAELNHSVVEFIVPTEYMVRAPQPAVYVFLIDVSHAAIQSGMVATATRVLHENLDRIPDDDNITKIGLIGFDVSLYFSMTPGSTDSTMLVVADTDDVFLPKPTDLLVNLAEARGALEALLERINDMFQDNSKRLGPCIASRLETHGTDRRKNTRLAVESSLSRRGLLTQLIVANLPHYTTSQTSYYPVFNAAQSEDMLKFAHEFGEVLAMPIMLECITRVRASRGLRMASFHGNFFVRSTDLLAMPTVPQNQSYAIEVDLG